MSLRDMIKRLWKARANKIEIPENKAGQAAHYRRH
jgi:hypothetical protein